MVNLMYNMMANHSFRNNETFTVKTEGIINAQTAGTDRKCSPHGNKCAATTGHPSPHHDPLYLINENGTVPSIPRKWIDWPQ